MSSQKCIKGQHLLCFWSFSHRTSCSAHYEPFGCSASRNSISWLSLLSISVLLSFVHWELPCSQCHYISIKATVLGYCTICKHSSVPSRYNPCSDRSVSPKIPRATDSRRPLVEIIQHPWSAFIWSYIHCWNTNPLKSSWNDNFSTNETLIPYFP